MIAFSDNFVPFENLYLLAIGRGQSMFWNLCPIPILIMYNKNVQIIYSQCNFYLWVFQKDPGFATGKGL